MVAAVELILGPRLSEMALRNAKAPPAGASYPPPVYQLLQANLLVSALALAVAVYGVVLALTWNGVVGLPFTLVSLVALVLQRPQWHRWQAHLGRAPREA